MTPRGPRIGGIRKAPLSPRHLEIERRYLAGETMGEIAKSYGVTDGTIQRIMEKVADARSLERVRRVRSG